MTLSPLQIPDVLVSGDWLEANLANPALRVFDCTTHLVYQENSDRPYNVVSGRPEHDAGHIPGAGYLDLQADFSVQDSPFRFTLPSPRAAADSFERHGVDDRTAVILYSRGNTQWATRFWWMLRWLGFDKAAVLDGGYDKWLADGRATDAAPCGYTAGSLSINPRPELFVAQEGVQAAIGDLGTCTLNALSANLHSGEDPRYGRPGRIPGSVNVPALSLIDADTRQLCSLEHAAAHFEKVGASPSRKVIAYCGGGIAATLDAFMLTRLGYTDIAVYDNSMSEWAKDESLPIETD